MGWHGDIGHSGFDPDIASAEARFGSPADEARETAKRKAEREQAAVKDWVEGNQPTPTKIEEFSGEFRFLSNFWLACVPHDGIEYPSTEHAYQAAKTLDFGVRWEISQLSTPGKAKRAGQKGQLRPDWEAIKKQVMTELTILKFAHHPGLKRWLLDTGTAELIEGNNWGDTYWGVCKGAGHNHLGQILMLVRDLLL